MIFKVKPKHGYKAMVYNGGNTKKVIDFITGYGAKHIYVESGKIEFWFEDEKEIINKGDIIVADNSFDIPLDIISPEEFEKEYEEIYDE